MNKKIRQYLGLLSAVLVYYLVHEGAHLVYALSIGVFRQINFMGGGGSGRCLCAADEQSPDGCFLPDRGCREIGRASCSERV